MSLKHNPLCQCQSCLGNHSSLAVDSACTGKPKAGVYPDTFSFGSVVAGAASVSQVAVLKNEGSADLLLKDIVITGPFTYSIDMAVGGVLFPGSQANITITFKPVDNGVVSGSIYLDTDSIGGNEFILMSGEGIRSGSNMDGYAAWPYNNGSALGGEQDIVVPDLTSNIPFAYLNGLFQFAGYSYTFDPATHTMHLSKPLEAGDELVLMLSGDFNDPTILLDSAAGRVSREALRRTYAEAGYNLVEGSFDIGGTVNTATDVLLNEVDGKAYSWGDTLPKTVPLGSTPATTGGVGSGKWVGVGDAVLRADLNNPAIGDAIIAVTQPFPGAVARTQHDKNAERITPQDFGAIGDGIQDDSPAFQAAIDAAGWGGKVYIPKPAKDYKLKSPVYIRGPLTIQGYGGSTVARRDMPRILVDGNFDAFVLVPTIDGYRFEYGISGVHICDLMIEGPGLDTRGRCGITVDTTVNNGVYHVRECCFERNHIRYMDHGFKIHGVCYLNEWHGNRVLWSGTGCEVDRVPGATEGGSDQSRFFGNEFVMNNVSLRLGVEGNGGSQTIIGNTLSESNAGLVIGSHTQACIMGNQIESNAWFGIGMNIGAGTNPACESSKIISGNSFLFNEVDIDVAKTSTLLTVGFPFSLRIESNSFQGTKFRVLRVTAPTGAQEFDSKMFIFGMDNVYSDANNTIGTVPPSMIETLWAGYRGYEEDGKVTITALVQDTWKNIGVINVPYGHQLSLKYKMVSFPTENTGANEIAAAGFKVYKLNDGTLIRDEFERGGSMFFSRSDVGLGLELLIAGGPNGLGNSAYIEVQYCII